MLKKCIHISASTSSQGVSSSFPSDGSQLSLESRTFAGDVVLIQDLVISTTAGAAVRNHQAEAAAAAVVEPTGVGT